MKNLKILALAMLMLCIPILSFGAGTCTQANSIAGSNDSMRLITFTCIGDASDGSFPATTLSTDNATFVIGQYLILAVTKPGSPAPTAAWAATVTTPSGMDVMGGTIAAQSATLTKQIVPLVGAVYGPRPIDTSLTLNITGNSVNSAAITVILYFVR